MGAFVPREALGSLLRRDRLSHGWRAVQAETKTKHPVLQTARRDWPVPPGRLRVLMLYGSRRRAGQQFASPLERGHPP